MAGSIAFSPRGVRFAICLLAAWCLLAVPRCRSSARTGLAVVVLYLGPRARQPTADLGQVSAGGETGPAGFTGYSGTGSTGGRARARWLARRLGRRWARRAAAAVARRRRAGKDACGCGKPPRCASLIQPAGRLGNNLQEWLYMLYMVQRLGWRGAWFDAHNSNLADVFDVPRQICLEPGEKPEPLKPKECHSKLPEQKFYSSPCQISAIKTLTLLQLSRKYMWPYIKVKLKKCVESPRLPEEEKLLTIHLRGEDIYGAIVKRSKRGYQIIRRHTDSRNQPPCAWYEKIISENDFQQVLILTTPDHANPCLAKGWVANYSKVARNKLGERVPIRIENRTLIEDTCSMLRARHVVASQSSFAYNLVAISYEVRNLYAFFENMGYFGYTLSCVRDDVSMWKYTMQGMGKYSRRAPNLGPEWMLKTESRDIGGPALCKPL